MTLQTVQTVHVVRAKRSRQMRQTHYRAAVQARQQAVVSSGENVLQCTGVLRGVKKA